ncbi:unnamed protein product [Closterium sp. Naga37s-1]|nr:unnamed protein product [Closterium sp. Naga37s-1]
MVGARTGVSASAAARSSARCLRRLRPRRARLAVVRLALGAAVVVVGAIAVTVRGSGAPVKRAGAGAREVAQCRQCRMQAVGMGRDGMQGGVLSLGSQRCSTLLTITALFVNGDSWVDVGNNHDGSHRFLRADLPLYGMSYIEALERFSDGRLKIDYLAEGAFGVAGPTFSQPPPLPPVSPLPTPPSPPFPCFPPISPVLHCSPSPPARYLGLPSPPPMLQQGRNASRGLYFARAESHTLDHRLLDAIHGSEGGYIVGGADSFYSRMAEQDAQAPRMGECGGRCGTGDGSSLIESLIKYPPLEEVRGLPEEIVGDEKEDMDFADVDASVEGEEDEDDGV